MSNPTDDPYARLGVIELRRLVRQSGKAQGPAVSVATREQCLAILRGELDTIEAPDLMNRQALQMIIRAEVARQLAEVGASPNTEPAAITPRPIVKPNRRDIAPAPEGSHKALQILLRKVAAGHRNIMIVGPAGTGKSTLAEHLARALGRRFAFLSLTRGIGEHHLFGRTLPDATGAWKHVDSDFIRLYEHGGVFLLDELDAADENVLVSIHAALTGQLSNPFDPGRIIKRHPDNLIIAAANTYGTGADPVYVGRSTLDGATLDRFVLAKVFVDYDRKLETSLTAHLPESDRAQLHDFVEHVRRQINAAKLRRMMSTRFVVNAVMELAAGSQFDAIKAEYLAEWKPDERAKITV